MSLLAPFPKVDPFDSGFLQVSDVHNIHYAQYGNPDGIPMLALHGGPGTGISANQIRTIDPALFRVITFDQRGSGKSEPFGCTEENTTQHLLDDIEAVREHFGIQRWVVTGRSWGSTLALVYAITHPDKVAGLIPVAVFLARQEDTDWLYQHGASEIYPEDWEKYVSLVPENERHDILGAYARMMATGSEEQRLAAAKSLGHWELCTLWLHRGASFDDMGEDENLVVGTGILETHYLTKGCFLQTDNWILENAHRLEGIPGEIVHGRYDMDCRVGQAWKLHHAWPGSKLTIVENAGHAQDHDGNFDACIRAMRSLADHVS